MHRKLIKQKTAYTITLPIEWIRENNLKAGEEINIESKDIKRCWPKHKFEKLIQELLIKGYKVKKLKLNEVKPMIEFTNGKIFSVKFEKLDGSLRHMMCRKGVKSYLRGGVSTTSNNSDIITVFDIKIKQYIKCR